MERQYVGIDRHRRRSVTVRMDEAGEGLQTVRIDNDPVALGLALAEAGPDPEGGAGGDLRLVLGGRCAPGSWARVHLVHLSGLHWGARRVKNDQRDATEIAHRLRRNDLPKAWIAPPKVRELRELVRFRVGRIVRRVAKTAGLGHVHPHQLRHTLATQVINRGMRLEAIAALLGHRSLRMTLTYARIANRTVAEEYTTTQARVDARYNDSDESADLTRPRHEHRRMLGNGWCTRPPWHRLHLRSHLRRLRLLRDHHRVRPHPESPTRPRHQPRSHHPRRALRRSPPTSRGQPMSSPDHRHIPFPLDPITRITAEMGAIVSWPGTCQHGAVNRHRGTPGGNVFDRAAGTYRTVGPDFFGYFGRRLVDRMGMPRGGRVMDLACGTGAALVPAAEAVGARGLSVGLDLSVAMLRRAGATDAGSGPQLRLACMDATHLAIRSESFDAVVCSFALDSFPDPLSALAECWRVAHPGGRLGLVVSDRWWWEGDERWSWHGDLLQAIGVPVAVTRFASAEAIDSVLKEAGWELRDLVTESFPMVFSGADEWWAWAWSHGYRQILESMGAAEFTLYRTECFRQLQQHGQPVLGRLEASLVGATRP